MANIKSAKKRIKVIETKTQRNKRVKNHLKEILKDFDAAIAAEDQKSARDKLALAEKKLFQATAKGTVHKNTAARKVSRLTAQFAKAFGSAALLEKADVPAAPAKEKKAAKVKETAPVEEAVIEEEVVAEEDDVAEETLDTEEEIPEVVDAEAEAEADAAETEEIAPDTEEEAAVSAEKETEA